MADRLEPRLERLKHLLLAEIGELLAETLEVAEGVLVDEADEAEEFEQRVLQRRGGEQELVLVGERQLERVGDDVGRLVDVAQAVRFVDDHEVPRGVRDIGGLVPRELVGADDDGVALKRAKVSLLRPRRCRTWFRESGTAGRTSRSAPDATACAGWTA